MNIDDFLDNFNWISRVLGVTRGAMTFLPHRNLRGHWTIQGGGWVEMRIRAADDEGRIAQTGGDAERLLAKFRIPIFGKRVRQKEFIFSVPRRQANFAEYILARHMTMADSHRWFNRDNQKYAARRAGQAMPAWADGSKAKDRHNADSPTLPAAKVRGSRAAGWLSDLLR